MPGEAGNGGHGDEKSVEDMLQDVMDGDLLETKRSILSVPPPAPLQASPLGSSTLFTPASAGDDLASLPSRRQSDAPEIEREGSLGFLSEQVGRHTKNLLSSMQSGRRASAIESDLDDHKGVVSREKVMALKTRIEDKITLASRYRSLLMFLLYCAMYVWVLYDQTDTDASYVVENSILSVVATPLEGKDLRTSDIYTWLQDLSLVIFKDPVCGDGVCEDPLEYAGFGRYGCESDCGRFPNTTTTFVNFEDPLASNPAAYTLATEMGGHPDWTWNAFSHTMGSFVFAEDQSVIGSSLFDIPDGVLDVCLYHRNKIYGKQSFQTSVLALLGTMDPQTMPAPEPRLNYDYGDAREALAMHAGIFTYLYVPEDNPTGTNLTVAPAISSKLTYGFFGAVGALASSGIGDANVLAYFNPCSLTDADIEAANLGQTCPSFIYPRATGCYDAKVLLQNWQCPACRTIDLREYSQPGDDVPVRPTNQPQRPVSPFNYIIGGIAIEQTRAVQVPCAPTSGEARFDCGDYCQQTRKRIFGSFYEESMCLGSNASSVPYGIDPAFLSSSSIFSGKLRPSDFGYEESDLSNAGVPFGFFPSFYKISPQLAQTIVNEKTPVLKGGDPVFRVYMDSRYGNEETMNAMAHLREGYFLDNLTKTVDVSLLTFNPVNDVFALCSVSFTFLDGGQIESTVYIKSRALSDFQVSAGRVVAMVLICLGSGAILRTEMSEVYEAWKNKDLASYFGDVWNILDILSFVSIPASVIIYDIIGAQVLATFPLAVNGTVPYILRDVNPPARKFRTDEGGEFAFLESVGYVKSLMGFLDIYSFWVGFNIMILTARFFKILHFQGRMGLVTRTFATALQDIIHFGMIFFLVIFAYGVMGVLLYGHQLREYRSMDVAMMTLIQTTLAISNEDYARLLTSNDNFMTTLFYLSFLFLSTITLLNIFLAILIDAFSTVKESSSHSETLMSGVFDVMVHDVRHMRSRLESARQGDGHPTRFIPDHQLKQLFDAWAFSLEDETTVAAKKAEMEKEEIVKDGVLRLDDGTEIGAPELAMLMVSLIAGAPDKVQELMSGQNRGMQLRSAINNFVSMAPMAHGASGGGGARGGTIAPEGGGGTSNDSLTQMRSAWKSPSNVLAIKYWQKVRDIFVEEEQDKGPLADIEQMHGKSSPDSILRLTKGILARYGETATAEATDDEALKLIKAQVLQKQVQQFQRTENIEQRVERMEGLIEKMAAQMDRLAGSQI